MGYDNMRKVSYFFIIAIFLILRLIFLSNDEKAYNILSSLINEKYGSNLSFERLQNYDRMKIDYVNIKSRLTGTAPFNDGVVSDDMGIDVSENDDYVRTFDSVKYTLEFGVSLNETINENSYSTISGGVVKVKAKLPNQNDEILMTWEEDAWMKNIEYNEDKTEIYAEYYISSDENIISANQSLSFTIRMNGYKKEVSKDMAPEFEIWMEGNSPDNEQSGIDSVKIKDDKNTLIISAKPSYDVDIKASTYLYPGYNNSLMGEYIGYGIGVALVQPYDYINDLRGVEYPTGNFEVELENTYSARNIRNSSKYVTVQSNTDKSLGVLNNTTMVAYSVNGVSNFNYYPTVNSYTRTLPRGINGGDRGVTDSGTMLASLDSNITTISFNNYVLDNNYPVRNIIEKSTVVNYPKYLGYFLSGNVQLFVPYYDNESTDSYDYLFNTVVRRIKYYDSNGVLHEINSSDEKNKSNNSINISFQKRNNGSFYVATNLTSNNSEGRDGLASSSLGSYINPSFTLMPVTGPYDSAERLIVWNTDFFELVKKSNASWVSITCNSELGFSCLNTNTISIKYGIYKNDENGVNTDEDVNDATKDDFVWYDTAEEALLNGKISAIYGYDSEVLGNRIHRTIGLKFKIVENNELIGKVGTIVHRTKIYEDEDKTIVYEPFKTTNYIKSLYDENGNIVRNHSTYNVGTSVLILGTKSEITTSVLDEDDNGKLKTSYDVVDGEVNIKLIPKILDDFNSNRVINEVKITSTIPFGLNYINNSSNKEPSNIEYNNDGTTTLTWIYNNWIVNNEAPEYPYITYKVEISDAISNNSSLNIKSMIFNNEDLRDVRYRSSDYTIFVSNLFGSKALKQISTQSLEKEEKFSVTSVIGNLSRMKLENIKGFEILPRGTYNGGYKLKVISLNEEQKLYYTEESIDSLNIEEDINGKKIIKTFDDKLWNEVYTGDEIPSSATALFTTYDSLDGSDSIQYELEVIPFNNRVGDSYSFSMNIISDNLMTALKTNNVVSTVFSRAISGKAFIDLNSNSKYDTEDLLLNDIEVQLLDENNNVLQYTKTDENGKYIFEGLEQGKYYVYFDIPAGYTSIEIDGNKVNNNGITDIIDYTNKELIDNIDLGICKRKINVLSHYYYLDTDISISDDNVKQYLFGDEYTTEEATDIPINYELASVTSNRNGIAGTDDIEVIYYYKMKDSTINNSISETGTDLIKDKKDEIEYNITYNSKVYEYIGDVNITIIDNLPFDIDIENSDLDGGIYSNEDKTITWFENINNIDTYKEEFDITLNKNIKVVYKDLILSDNFINNNVSGKIELTNNKKDVESTFSTILEIPSTIVEYYYEKDTNKELMPSVTSKGFVGQKYQTNSIKIDGYDLIEDENVDYKYSEEEQNIVHMYVKAENPNTLDNVKKYIIVFIMSFVIINLLFFVRNKSKL